MIRKAVLPVAGFGTRLLPMTKEMPKEMFPIFLNSLNGEPCLKPLVQAIFEQLYDTGFREFGLIVGRGKRAIEDHFTPDEEFIKKMEQKNRANLGEDLRNFNNRVNNSTIIFINQPKPKGFGDAVLKAKCFVNEDFLVHAGDTYIFCQNHSHIQRLIETHEKLNADATMLVQEVEDPRIYGVIEGKQTKNSIYNVTKAVEKPEKPPTNLAIIPIYILKPLIFKALETMQQEKKQRDEMQLTDGIQKLIEWGSKVYAIKLPPNATMLDIGNPESCWQAFNLSYQKLKKNRGTQLTQK